MDKKIRNFSAWAYWSLHLASVELDDPIPGEHEGRDRLDEWLIRVRERLTKLLGDQQSHVPLDAEFGEPIDCGEYTRSRVVYDTEPAMSVPAYLLVPKDRATQGPAVLAVHGHGPGKDLICGLTGAPFEHYAIHLARLGYVVLAPDLRCFGERQDPQWEPWTHKYDCDWNLVAATMAGVSPLSQNLWDLQRSIDALAEHPLVDSSRIGVAGLSYGGTMALFLAALDTRVRAAVVSGYVSSWKSAHTVPWNMCGSQVMFGQLGKIEHVDIAALIAPRALLVETGEADELFPLLAATQTMDSLRRVWGSANSDVLVHAAVVGGHRWHGAMVEEFLGRNL